MDIEYCLVGLQKHRAHVRDEALAGVTKRGTNGVSNLLREILQLGVLGAESTNLGRHLMERGRVDLHRVSGI